MNTFKAALSVCGLSQREAAEYLDVALDTVKKWCSGKNPPPAGVWAMLADLFYAIEVGAERAEDVMDLEGVDPRAWHNVSVDLGDNLPGGAEEIAGAMALLRLISADNASDL